MQISRLASVTIVVTLLAALPSLAQAPATRPVPQPYVPKPAPGPPKGLDIENLSGTWTGNVTCRGQYIEPQPWPLTVNVVGANGHYTVTASTPNGSGAGTINGTSVTFTMKIGPLAFLMPNVAHFTGTVTGDTMRGSYVQGGNTAPCSWFARAPDKGKGSEKEWRERCKDLQEKAKRACDPGLGLKRECVGLSKKLEGDELAEYCEKLKSNRAQNEACRNARVEVARQCYSGGDPKHRQEIDEARKARDKCDRLLAQYCQQTQ